MSSFLMNATHDVVFTGLQMIWSKSCVRKHTPLVS
ncbi:hypothetical protein GGQ88_003948 [Novosphingobium hassiacum]|uniref:Uncharacterized protein n=1 Tax=Novosphingobium hassiacum TaxID=173676 RepID=A0A7W6A025_9SPHN|nr:hypothetical protein [Novosphingobium hassiacum]